MDKEKKRFLIHVSTNWCGMDQEYSAIAESEFELDDIAEQLAYDNFLSYNLWRNIAEDNGCDPDEMTQEEWDNFQMNVDESSYYSYTIEEFDGTEEEWSEYGTPFEVNNVI